MTRKALNRVNLSTPEFKPVEFDGFRSQWRFQAEKVLKLRIWWTDDIE